MTLRCITVNCLSNQLIRDADIFYYIFCTFCNAQLYEQMVLKIMYQPKLYAPN